MEYEPNNRQENAQPESRLSYIAMCAINSVGLFEVANALINFTLNDPDAIYNVKNQIIGASVFAAMGALYGGILYGSEDLTNK